MRRVLILVLVLGWIHGCSDADFQNPRLVEQGRPIFYGENDTNPAHEAVVAITNGPGTAYFCSGTLITDSVVLTAGHCLEGESASNIEVYFGNNVYQGGTYRQAADLEVHPQYDGWNILNDIALIRMASTAPSDITPIPHLPEDIGLTSADVGETVDFSGFGLTETGSDGVKLHVENNITQVCSGPNSCGDVVAKAFGYNQDGGGPCSGDSGGPAFLFRSGTEYVAGVTSYGDQQCTEFGVSTTVSQFAPWIENYISGGGTENCENDIDDDSDGRTDCDDYDCNAHPACVGPGACEDAQVVTCGSQINDTTVGGSTTYQLYSCDDTTEEGPEKAFYIDLPAGTNISAVMRPTGVGDLDLFLLPASGGTCNLLGCLDASYEPNNTAEQIDFAQPSGGAYLVVETWDTASTFQLEIQCEGPVENCVNQVDDDQDGDTDCDDADCDNHPDCQVPDENCTNDIDDDQDGDTDCDDADCANHPDCQVPDENCTNDIDDDQDGATDCDDTDCASHANCQTFDEDCTNGVDDDRDGFLDCEDTDCVGHSACVPDKEVCDNGTDDDQDGATDCADPECAGLEICQEEEGNSGGCQHAGGSGLPSLPMFFLAGLLMLRRKPG